MASPTLLLEGLFTTLVIDAHEGREISTFDVKGAYLHADMPREKNYIKINRNIRGYNVSYQYGTQEKCGVRKWAGGLIYVGITGHI